ncbi:GATA zinc finger domain-containing protein 14-like isoform X2 [Papilio machaon]|uniref:GATA zinc finger domain-containing protein 14-like isoform X2 n=1 Tax=Papilio machaon TaxID=76193 RepID=UPI001E6631A1|nr:GATA zinc finger domain-containing protein 14-like isoform X2 [Papilio machaon]
MYSRIIIIALLVLLVQQNVDARKQRKTKQPTETESPVPQPSVLTYSTFGFNDVASRDGFVPTSPEYSNYHNKYKESSEKLYAPAFPSAPDPDFTSNSQSLNGEPFTNTEGGQQSNMVQFNPTSFYRSSNVKSEDTVNKNSDGDYNRGSENNNNPVYGTKISYNNRNISFNGYNNSEIVNSESYNNYKYSNFDDSHYYSDNKPLHGGSVNSNQNLYDYTTYPTQEVENSMKAAPVNSQGSLNFPKVLEFTNPKHYDTLETENKYTPVMSKPLDTFNSLANSGSNGMLSSYEDKANKHIKMSPGFKNVLNNNVDTVSKEIPTTYQSFANKYSNSKYNAKSKKLNYDYKDVGKNKPWTSDNNDKKHSNNNLKGYEYANNFSSTSFKFDDNEHKTKYNSNTDELISLSSNNIGYSNYHLPQYDHTNIKPTPGIKHLYTDIRDALPKNNGNSYSPSEDYLNKFKNLYGTVPMSSTNWGSIFKNTDYSSYKTHNYKPTQETEENYDYVHIPKRPNNYRFEKDSDSVLRDWSAYSKKHNTFSPHNNEWNKEKYNNRFKSEEDLLGLRNHDTSHPSYLPTFQYHGNEDSDESFKEAVEKWREDYIKTKYRDNPNYDYEASEAKHVHSVNPYQVPVPVVKPYPVAVPQIRPVFHHSRPFAYRDEYDDHDDDDYFPRPESSNIVYNKRPKSPRSRLRRPSRMSHQERSKTRRPQRRPNSSRERDQRRYVKPSSEYNRFRYHDNDFEDDHDHSDYFTYCKRIGNC